MKIKLHVCLISIGRRRCNISVKFVLEKVRFMFLKKSFDIVDFESNVTLNITKSCQIIYVQT